MPPSSYSMSLRDQTRELASHTFPIATVTAGNYAGLLVLGAAYEAAVDAVVLGIQAKRKIVAFENIDVAVPSNGNAQVEMAWIVHYHDDEEFFDAPTNAIPNENYGVPQTIRIATPDAGTTALRQPNSDLADLTHANWIAFVSAFEGFALSQGGGDVVVDYIELSRGAK